MTQALTVDTARAYVAAHFAAHSEPIKILHAYRDSYDNEPIVRVQFRWDNPELKWSRETFDVWQQSNGALYGEW